MSVEALAENDCSLKSLITIIRIRRLHRCRETDEAYDGYFIKRLESKVPRQLYITENAILKRERESFMTSNASSPHFTGSRTAETTAVLESKNVANSTHVALW